MAYNQKLLDKYRADALAGRPFTCSTCPYCNGERDPTVKHIHPSTKPASPWDFWQHVLLNKYRAVQSTTARRNTALRFPVPAAAGNEEEGHGRSSGEGPCASSSSSSSEEKLFVVGPMVDQSELPFRMLCREYGANLAYTPMLHARSYADGAAYRRHYFTTTPPDVVRDTVKAKMAERAKAGEAGDGEARVGEALVDRPCIVQFCGHDPDTILQAARYAVHGEYTDPHSTAAIRGSPSEAGGESGDEEFYYYCDAVDLNLGCPQGIAKRGHYGSFLMEDWDLIHTIIHTLHVELEVPVTAKIRVFDQDVKEDAGDGERDAGNSVGQATLLRGKMYDEVLSLYYAQMVRDAGAQLLCIHGRTREMKGQLSGLANLALIAKMRAALSPPPCRGNSTDPHGTPCPQERPSIPVISNGNVLTFADVLQAIRVANSDGHMCAEPLLWDPALFSQPAHPVLSGRLPTGADKAARLAGIHTALNYVKWLRVYPVDLGFVKAHLFKMCFHSYELHTAFRDQVGRLRTSRRAAAGGAPAREGQDDGQDRGNTCDCHDDDADSGDRGDEETSVLGDADAIEAHLLALLAVEEASDVLGEQPKTAQAEKRAAKASIIDVFEEEGDLCINF